MRDSNVERPPGGCGRAQGPAGVAATPVPRPPDRAAAIVRDRLVLMRVSVVTVTYEAASFLGPFLADLGAQVPAPEVIVVDNASRDGSADVVARELPVARLVRAPRNLGFAGGSNLGAAEATGDVLVFLNPDTRFAPDAVAALASGVPADDIGVVGAKLVFPDGRIQGAGGLLEANGVAHQRGWGETDRGQYDTEDEVDYVPGAALAIRRAVFRALGGFHEGYFPGFYEDTELCVRARRRGLRVCYRPAPRIVHLGSPTMGRRAHFWLTRNRRLFLARTGWRHDQPHGVVSELGWLYRAQLRPLAARLARRQTGVWTACLEAGAVAAGEVAGTLAAWRVRA